MPTLDRTQFRSLVARYVNPSDSTENSAADTLFYFGPQTLKWIEKDSQWYREQTRRVGGRRKKLENELTFNTVHIELKLVADSQPVAHVDARAVPLGVRHEFVVESSEFNSTVITGTIKRVGSGHLWARL